MTDPHPHDEDPEQHIGGPVADPWIDDPDPFGLYSDGSPLNDEAVIPDGVDRRPGA